MGVQPDDSEPVVACSEPFDRADVGTAATTEDDRPLGKRGCQRQILLGKSVFLDDADLGIRQGQIGSLDHGLAALSPSARHADESGVELPTARMAFVRTLERDRRQSAAVWTTRTQAAHVPTVPVPSCFS